MMRHACGFKLANDGQDTRALQQYLGYKNIQHTVRYTEPANGQVNPYFADCDPRPVEELAEGAAVMIQLRLWRVSATLPAMSRTVCRHALGCVRHGYGAAPRCRHGWGDRWGTPRKVPVGSYRWPGRECARRGSVS